jgi:hypothetical protein
MKLFNVNASPWVAIGGEVRVETESQIALVSTLMFKITLGLYKDAFEKMSPYSEDRRAALNSALQKGYDKDIAPQANELPIIAQP